MHVSHKLKLHARHPLSETNQTTNQEKWISCISEKAFTKQYNRCYPLTTSLPSPPLHHTHRAAGIPAWIEALMAPGSNTSQSLQDAQTLLQSFSQQDPNDQVQALLAKVFVDVTQGLQSLNVTSNSTSQDVISAILNDPG